MSDDVGRWVEAGARAVCAGAGLDPDEEASPGVPRWLAYKRVFESGLIETLAAAAKDGVVWTRAPGEQRPSDSDGIRYSPDTQIFCAGFNAALAATLANVIKIGDAP